MRYLAGIVAFTLFLSLGCSKKKDSETSPKVEDHLQKRELPKQGDQPQTK